MKAYEDPLSRCGISILEPRPPTASLKLHVEVEPISHISKAKKLVISAAWGDGP